MSPASCLKDTCHLQISFVFKAKILYKRKYHSPYITKVNYKVAYEGRGFLSNLHPQQLGEDLAHTRDIILFS